MKIEQKEYVEWKSYNGVRYLHISFCEARDLDALGVLMRVIDTIKTEPIESIRVISDVTHMDVSFNTHKTITVMSKMYQKLIYKSAFIGMNKVVQPFYGLYRAMTGSKSIVLETEEEALEYITSG